jgi:carboxylesterase type B
MESSTSPSARRHRRPRRACDEDSRAEGGRRPSARFAGGGQDATAFADKISDAWIAFARTGDPTRRSCLVGPSLNASRRPTMVFT